MQHYYYISYWMHIDDIRSTSAMDYRIVVFFLKAHNALEGESAPFLLKRHDHKSSHSFLSFYYKSCSVYMLSHSSIPSSCTSAKKTWAKFLCWNRTNRGLRRKHMGRARGNNKQSTSHQELLFRKMMVSPTANKFWSWRQWLVHGFQRDSMNIKNQRKKINGAGRKKHNMERSRP